MVFKFIQELKDSFNEGREEAKQEALEKEQSDSQERTEILKKIENLSKIEIFGCSLAGLFVRPLCNAGSRFSRRIRNR